MPCLNILLLQAWKFIVLFDSMPKHIVLRPAPPVLSRQSAGAPHSLMLLVRCRNLVLPLANILTYAPLASHRLDASYDLEQRGQPDKTEPMTRATQSAWGTPMEGAPWTIMQN